MASDHPRPRMEHTRHIRGRAQAWQPDRHVCARHPNATRHPANASSTRTHQGEPVTLECTDSTRDARDQSAVLAKQLRENPVRWARIGKGDRYAHDFLDCLYGLGIEYRIANERETAIDGRARRVADLYARAPQEAE